MRMKPRATLTSPQITYENLLSVAIKTSTIELSKASGLTGRSVRLFKSGNMDNPTLATMEKIYNGLVKLNKINEKKAGN